MISRRGFLQSVLLPLIGYKALSYDGPHRFTAVVARADIPNKNFHIYTKEVLEKVVKDFKKPLYGGIGIPKMPTKIQPSEVSHVVDKLELKDENLICEGKVLDTPQGNKLRCLLNNNSSMGFRTCGFGEVEGSFITNYNLCSIDLLENPA